MQSALAMTLQPAPVLDFERCPDCGIFLSGAFYLVCGEMVCAVCAIQARARQRSHVGIVRGVLLALVGAVLFLVWPFLRRQAPMREALGAIVIFVGIRILWQLTAGYRLHLDGPYQAWRQSEGSKACN